MYNINDKIDEVSTLPAEQFNSLKNELENLITGTGQTLSSADNFQIAKSVADYSAYGDCYTDTGSASAYVLSPVGSLKAAHNYANGMRVRFFAANNNSGACTINVNSLGVKDIKNPDGTALKADTIRQNQVIELVYQSPNFVYPDYAQGDARYIRSSVFLPVTFLVKRTSNQTLVSSGPGVRTPILFDSILNDSKSFYTAATGKFQPNFPCLFQFTLNGLVTINAAGTAGLAITKNGTDDFATQNLNGVTSENISISGACLLNGTTDFVEFILAASGGPLTATYTTNNEAISFGSLMMVL